MILVSSCLLGLKTRYDGKANDNSIIMNYSHLGKYIPVCPEQLGGLSTPREPAEITEGSGEDVLDGKSNVVTNTGEDGTEYFIRGAEEVLNLAKTFPVKAAILKDRSPSCGVNRIYNGDFSSTIQNGQGVTAAILRKHGIPIYSEEDVTEDILKELLLKL